MYKMTRSEQETIIRWDAEEGTAHIFTANPKDLRRLAKLAAESPEAYRCVWADSQTAAKKYVVDARYIRFAKPASEARKEASRKNGLNSGFKPANLPHRETSTPQVRESHYQRDKPPERAQWALKRTEKKKR